MNRNVMMQALDPQASIRVKGFRKLISLCAVAMFLSSCFGAKEIAKKAQVLSHQKNHAELVVLVDDTLALYRQVITGIHVASFGNYHLLPLQDEGFSEAWFLQELLNVRPRGLIALGPRSANVVIGLRILLPSAFSMVPRIDNYDLDSVFTAGIRMVPDLKEQINFIRTVMPDLKALGVIFTRQNSRNALQKLRSLCDDEQFELMAMEVQSASNVLPTLVRESHQFQALLMLDDPVLLELEVLLAATRFLAEKKIALFALDCSMVKEGALFSFGTNFFTLGRDLTRLVLQKNTNADHQFTTLLNPKSPDICINLATAELIGNAQAMLSRVAEYASDKRGAIKAYR